MLGYNTASKFCVPSVLMKTGWCKCRDSRNSPHDCSNYQAVASNYRSHAYFRNCEIGVATKARRAGSHAVANRIYSVILQKFTSSIEGSASTSQHVWPVIQEDTVSDKNSTDDEDIFEDDGSSADSESNDSITTSCTSSGISDQEHSCQVDGGNQMMVDELQQSHHSTSAFAAE